MNKLPPLVVIYAPTFSTCSVMPAQSCDAATLSLQDQTIGAPAAQWLAAATTPLHSHAQQSAVYASATTLDIDKKCTLPAAGQHEFLSRSGITTAQHSTLPDCTVFPQHDMPQHTQSNPLVYKGSATTAAMSLCTAP